MPRLINTRRDARKQTQRVDLDGSVFYISLTWRERVAGWYLDVYDASGAPAALGRRLSARWSPTLTATDERLPPGAFVVVGPSEYVREDLGGDLLLTYVTEAEILQAAGGA